MAPSLTLKHLAVGREMQSRCGSVWLRVCVWEWEEESDSENGENVHPRSRCALESCLFLFSISALSPALRFCSAGYYKPPSAHSIPSRHFQMCRIHLPGLTLNIAKDTSKLLLNCPWQLWERYAFKRLILNYFVYNQFVYVQCGRNADRVAQ